MKSLMEAINEEKELQAGTEEQVEEITRGDLKEMKEVSEQAWGKGESEGLPEYTQEMLEEYKNRALKVAEEAAKSTLTYMGSLKPDAYELERGDKFEYLSQAAKFGEFISKHLQHGEVVYSTSKYNEPNTMRANEYISDEVKHDMPKMSDDAIDDAWEKLEQYIKEAEELFMQKLVEGVKEFFD